MNKDNSKKDFSGKHAIEEALHRLNARMVYAQIPSMELVICGGASLNILGWVSRSTGDVDIICLAKVDPKGKVKLVPGKNLPNKFTQAIVEVGRELGIKEEWLNFGPEPLLKFGLPTGLENRLKRKCYGNCLALHMISRWDQIHLKIYAVMHPKTRVEIHLSDLLDLKPTEKEAKAAMDWLLKRKTSADFRKKLKSILDRIGHEKLAETI